MKTSLIKTTLLMLGLAFLSLLSATVGIAGENLEMSLQTAIKVALEKNIDLKLFEAEIDSAKGGLEEANGAFAPVFEAGTSGTENRLRALTASGVERELDLAWWAGLKKKFDTGTEVDLTWSNGRQETDPAKAFFDPAYSSTVNLGFSHPLLRGHSKEIQTAGIRAANKRIEAAAMGKDEQTTTLVGKVKKAYWELLFARQAIEVRQLSLELARNLRSETRDKIEAGVLAPVDIHRPDAEVARREELLISGEQEIGRNEDELKLLLNLPDWGVTIIPTDTPEVSALSPDLEQVIANALALRSDIKAAEKNIEIADIRTEESQDSLRPALALSGGVGFDGLEDGYGDSLLDITEPNSRWQIGLSFTLPLDNQGAQGKHIQAKAAATRSRVAAELLRQAVVRSSREAVRNVELARKSIEAARKTVTASSKGLEAEKAKFATGLSTAIDVLEVQEQYSLALMSEKRALINYAQAQAALDLVQGLMQ